MHKTVYDLSREELDELRESYFYQLEDYDDEVLENIMEAKQIPDDVIFEHYDGVSFTDDDFFCNQEGEE